jgi:hypothetical protein
MPLGGGGVMVSGFDSFPSFPQEKRAKNVLIRKMNFRNGVE